MKCLARNIRRPVRALLACALASCLLMHAQPSLAQSADATIHGQVTLGSVPAKDAKVTATNLASGFSRSVPGNGNGDYSLNGLPPGSYRIDVAAAGKATSKIVTVLVGQVATLDLAVGALADVTTLGAVVVKGTPLVETRTSEIATYVTKKQIAALPQASRNFLAFADIIPGMVFSTDPGDGSTSLKSGAQNSNGINVFIDGVGQKNYVLKGGVAGQDSSRGNPFPQLGIAEYKVITSNYKAEFDQISSAAIVAVTSSGTNTFKGELFGDFSNQSLRAPSPQEQLDGAKTPSRDEQFGDSFGGPILQDRMHFFVTYERKEFNSPRSIDLGDFTLAQLPPNLAALANATSGAPFTEDLYFGKIDWEPGDNHLFELTAKYRREDELTGIGGSDTASYGTLKTGGDTRLDLRYQYNGNAFLNDAHLTYEDSTFGTHPATIGPGYQLTGNRQGRPATSDEVILNTGGGPDFQNKGQKGSSFQDDLTFNRFDWNGSHTVKLGLKYKAIDINAFEQQPYNPQFSYDINNSLTIPYQVQFGAVVGNGNRNILSHNSQLGLYLQDDWEVNSHWLFNLGVRWDYEQTPAYNNYVTPSGVVDALRNWSNIHQPRIDYNIEDYISNGHNRSSFKDAFQPRIGFSYDIDANQRHVFFGGIGRAYDRNLFDYLALEQSASTFPSYTYQFDSPAHHCTVGTDNCLAWNPSYQNPAALAALVAANPDLGSEVDLINNRLKTPYSDQFSFGMRNLFPMWGNDWESSVTFEHIVSHDGIVFTLGNRFPHGNFRPSGTTWGHQPWNVGIPGFGTLILASNGIQTRLNSLLVSLEKPYSHESGWGMTFAYTYSNAEENRGNAYNSDEHYEFDYPNVDGSGFTRSLGLAKHRLVMTGIYDAMWGITLSGKLTLASPAPLESLNCHDVPDANHCFYDPFTPHGTFGFKQLDLAVEKEWALGADSKFNIRGDLLNVFNWRNYTDFDTWRGDPSPAINPTFGQRNGTGIDFPTRMLKVSAGFTW